MIISIYGGSGTGKSTLAKRVVELLGGDKAERIPVDYFLTPRSTNQSLVSYLNEPLKYDWELLEEKLKYDPGTLVETPDFDFESFTRRSETGGKQFYIRELMVVDSMLPYPKSDKYIFVHLSDEKRRKRIKQRDLIWGTQVINYWHAHQLTLTESAKVRNQIDLVLDGEEKITINTEAVAKLISG